MTGFGKAECIFQNRRIIVEIKSLNSKFQKAAAYDAVLASGQAWEPEQEWWTRSDEAFRVRAETMVKNTIFIYDADKDMHFAVYRSDPLDPRNSASLGLAIVPDEYCGKIMHRAITINTKHPPSRRSHVLPHASPGKEED